MKTLLIVEKCKMAFQRHMKRHFTPTRLTTIKKPNYISVGKGKKQALLYTANETVNSSIYLCNNCVTTNYLCHHPVKLNTYTFYDPTPRNIYKNVHSIAEIRKERTEGGQQKEGQKEGRKSGREREKNKGRKERTNNPATQ